MLAAQITWLKQDLPFTEPLDHVSVDGGPPSPVLGARSHIRKRLEK